MTEKLNQARSIMNGNPKSNLEDSEQLVCEVPNEVFESLNQQAEKNGGEWQLSPEHEGCIGWTMFDMPSSNDGTIIVLLPQEKIEASPRQSLVRVKSLGDQRSYLGAVVEGPFAEPDGLRADAPIIVNTTVKGGLFMPKFHGRIHVQIMGEELPDGGTIPPRHRPLPNSPVFILSDEETAEVLKLGGLIRLGLADGHETLEVRIPVDKSVLPRHIGILGTTGGGKSTTVSGQVAQFQKAGIATIILDTEGEYTSIDQPAENLKMLKALERRGLEPEGVKGTYIYHLVGKDTANEKHPRKMPFTLEFSELSPHTIKEILGFTEAQERRFFQAYDVCKLILRDFNIYPTKGNQQEQQAALELDELDTGYPKLTLSYLIDIAGVFLHVALKTEGEPNIFNQAFKGSSKLARIIERVKAANSDNEISWRALLGKLWQLHRLKIFDNPKARSINYEDMLQSGRVSIIDLSDLESAVERNLVIAQLLKSIQRQQDENYQAAILQSKVPTPTMVLIEEAHEFLSAQRINQMPVLFQQVAKIAKRGRKRWLGLVFITQLPQHLPDEVLGLINNWILHKISDSTVISRLRRSISGLDNSMWDQMPALAPGQAIVSFTSMTRPLQVAIDPTPCRLLMVD
jgi:DNA helicase HerA-like ATPase